MSGGADASSEGVRVGRVGDGGDDEVAEFDPGVGCGGDVWSGTLAAECFGPVPLGGVGAAALGKVGEALLSGEAGDVGGFLVCGVVFPEPGEGVWVVGELWMEGEGRALAIDGDGGGAGGIDADSDDAFGAEVRVLGGEGDGVGDGVMEAVEVIGGVLSGEIWVAVVEDDAVGAVVIGVRCGGDFES